MKQDYEFRIFSENGTVSLIIHSIHFNDIAAIRSARIFAGNRPFEVWRDLQKISPGTPRAVGGRLTFRSASEPPGTMPAKSAENTKGQARMYEFRLSAPGHDPLLFAAILMSDDLAADHARTLLKRHGEMDCAEIWRGMNFIRQV